MAQRKILQISIFVMLCLAVHCRKKPSDYIREAREALEDENTGQAIFYFQKAYESSLDDRFFPISRDNQYSQMEISQNGTHLVLVTSSEEKSDFIYQNLQNKGTFIEIEGYLGDKKIKYSILSPNGKYVLFLAYKDEKKDCELIVWESSEEKFIKTFPHLSCDDRPAISSDGMVLFMKRNQIYYWKQSVLSDDNEPVKLWVEKTPDKPFAKQKAKSFFVFSSQGLPFMTYGIAGAYKLYALNNKNLLLLTKKGSYYKIFFMQEQINPGVITGGASQQRFTFFHPRSPNQVIKQYDIPVLKDISFVSENEYYAIESGRLYQTKNEKSVALPFFAKSIVAQKGKGVFLLSSLGTFLYYDGYLPNRLSQKIFAKTLDIEESK